jgi:hypothetical protein
LQRLASYGIGFHSYTEPHLATDNELVRDILLALLLATLPQQVKLEQPSVGLSSVGSHYCARPQRPLRRP